jgi:hypothetical protein
MEVILNHEMSVETRAGGQPELSVVMPCLNEAETLQACVEKARDGLRAAGVSGEIIVGDNGSTDGSREIALGFGARVVDVKEKGYGSALQGGIAAAAGKWVLIGDSDGSHDFSQIPRFVAALREGVDLVMGNRFRGGITKGAMPWSHRYFGNPALTYIARLFFKAPSGDVYCGLRAFTMEAYRKMDLRSTGMEFAVEMVVKAGLLGMRVAEVPATHLPAGRSRAPHMRTWRDGWRTLRFLLMYSPRWLFLYPGTFLLLLGLAAGTLLLLGQVTIGPLSFGINTLLYASAAVILGFQAIAFGIFTKIFAVSEGLLPEDPKLERAFKYVTLELGLAVGGGVTAVGFAAAVYSVFTWGTHQFLPMDPARMIRIVMPAVTALMLGVEIILSSFLASILALKRR